MLKYHIAKRQNILKEGKPRKMNKATLFVLLVVAVAASGYGKGGKPRLCGRFCPLREELPVCGSDGKTYSSRCHLDNESCRDESITFKHHGECEVKLCARLCQIIPGSPVCGSDGKTYPSSCHLENERCSGREITLKHRGHCRPTPSCPGACPAVYDPVCGTDGKTYPTVCDLLGAVRCEGREVSVKHEGECRCGNTACPLYVDPVCGNDGRTYSNSCFFAQAACRNPGLAVAYDGPCERKTSPIKKGY